MIRRMAVLALLGAAVMLAGITALACGGGDKKDESDAASAATPGVTTAGSGEQILGIVPNAPPRPSPTPFPPGFTPTPRPPAVIPEAKVVPLFMYVDTVTAGKGESKFNVDPTLNCMQSSVFRRGMHVVWRMSIVDTSTGKVLQTADVASAVLKLPNGETKTFSYGGHGGTNIEYYFWTTSWDVPPDYAIGVIDFTIEVTTKDGKVGTFKQLPVSNPASGVESRLQVIG